MDSVTQAVLGAGIQGVLLGRVQGRRALIYGAALATVPDLDVLMSYPDPVSLMTYHRGFSHSVFVLTGLALLLAWLIRKYWPQAPYSGRRLFLTLWLVLVTHPILDALTVYGTQLFWPLPAIPESWAAVFIIDPLYTVPLLLGVLFATAFGMTRTARRLLAAALVFSTAYLGFGLAARVVAEHRVLEAMRGQGVAVAELRAVPMPFNTLVWRVIAKTADGHYYESVSSLFDRDQPEWLRQPLNLELGQALAGVPLHERLRWFTDDWLRYDAIGDALIVSDLRMGMAGHYTFRFKMAERAADGSWKPVTPSVWPSDRGGWAELKLVLARILHAQPPLPLAQWSEGSTK
ncbi:hydrolase [Achromobacter sp. Root83]|uniref:metal-dependent hydrolase n=1 Tax=Achromobacter sp. Root83 TaxID=1736602 RepID=UPI00070EBBCE|nr:metal-dependent hydrolase [Achromobacter sp. Root83]KRC85780.1 hydrolase [Achromobacter sp. Root83]